jgi:AraC-like DNA-binding protein
VPARWRLRQPDSPLGSAARLVYATASMNRVNRSKAWGRGGEQLPPTAASSSRSGTEFIAHVMDVTQQLLPAPPWFARYPITLTSPSVRQALWARGRRLTGNEDLGFVLAEQTRFEALGSLWRLFETAPSLRALHESYVHWSSSLFSDFSEPFAEVDGDRVRLSSRMPQGLVLDRGEQDWRAAMTVRLWRVLHRHAEVAPLSIGFTYPRPRSVRRHESALGTLELRFSQPTFEQIISRRLFDAPLPGADAQVFSRLDAAVREAARGQEAQSLTATADATATRLLATQGASAHSVARVLGLSVRTLRRRLAEEGRSFRALLDGVRQRETQLLLELGLYTMKQLALRVGFANDRALRHAIRRWNARKNERR